MATMRQKKMSDYSDIVRFVPKDEQSFAILARAIIEHIDSMNRWEKNADKNVNWMIRRLKRNLISSIPEDLICFDESDW